MEPIILFKSRVGSRAYNLHTEDSDYDYRYVQASPLRHALSPFRRLDTKAKTDGNDDDAIWELSAFLKYCANGNPSVFEALYSGWLQYGPAETCPLVDELLANKYRFLDARRIYDAHRGYATAQLKKIDWGRPEGRTLKAIVAYFRVLDQGTALLDDPKNLSLWYRPGLRRHFYMSVKTGVMPIDQVRKQFDIRSKIKERELQRAFEGTKIGSPDYDWIEEFNERAYRTLFP